MVSNIVTESLLERIVRVGVEMRNIKVEKAKKVQKHQERIRTYLLLCGSGKFSVLALANLLGVTPYQVRKYIKINSLEGDGKYYYFGQGDDNEHLD